MNADVILGSVTVLMTVLGGILSVHAPEKSNVLARVGYVAAFVILGIVSFVYVVKQSRENASASQTLSDTLVNLRAATADIAIKTQQNTALQAKLLAQSDTITDLSKQNLASVTGGDTFTWIEARFDMPNDLSVKKFRIMSRTRGKNPMCDVLVNIFSSFGPTKTPEEIKRHFESLHILNNFPHDVLPGDFQVAEDIDSGRHFIMIYARNGTFKETLDIAPCKGHWEQAVKLTEDGKILHLEPGTTGCHQSL
jgi:hypothetical protein